MSSSGNDSSKPKCSKVLEGKNKGKRCRNIATLNGLCKLHATSAEVNQEPFNSELLGIKRYKALEDYINKQEAPTIPPQTGRRTNEETKVEKKRVKKGPPPRDGGSSSPSSSKGIKNTSKTSSEEVKEVQDYPGALSSSRNNNNYESEDNESESNSDDEPIEEPPRKKKKSKLLDDDDSGYNIKVVMLMGASCIAKMIERKQPKLKGLENALGSDEYWVKSYVSVMEGWLKEGGALEALTPEWALVLSTAMITVNVYNSNDKDSKEPKPSNSNPAANDRVQEIDEDNMYD